MSDFAEAVDSSSTMEMRRSGMGHEANTKDQEPAKGSAQGFADE